MLLGVCCPAVKYEYAKRNTEVKSTNAPGWPNTIIDPVSNLLIRVENSALIGIHGCSNCDYIEENIK